MSYQLIYNQRLSQKKHWEQSGVLVKSQDMPAWLEDIVLHSCRIQTGREDTPLKYTYRVITVETGEFHVLSCAAGSGIHNLILTPAEITKLRRNANRPTPAGIMLALESNHFWAPDTAQPSLHCEEPKLAASALPEADFQPTWKELTGHKNNALAFLTPPYNKECLIQMPDDMKSRSILKLLHESDWLSSQRGWGRTFTTLAYMGDSFAETSRIFMPKSMADTPECSVWSQEAAVLDLCTPFILGDQQERPESEVLSKNSQTTGETGKSTHLPYVYQESPDEYAYNIYPRSHPFLRWSLYISGLFLLGAGVHLMVSEKAEDAGKATSEAIKATNDVIKSISPENSIFQLRKLTAAPYSPDSITQTLDKIYANLTTAAPDSEAELGIEHQKEVINILKHAGKDTTGHATNIRRLRECATALNIDADKLSELYLREATHDCTVQDWEHNLSPAELEDWQSLLETAPGLREILGNEVFAPYASRILLPTQEQEESQSPVAPAEQVEPPTLPAVTCVEGEPLPEPLARILQQAPVELNIGQWSIIRRYPHSFTRTRHTGELSENEHVLRVERMDEQTYRIVSNQHPENGIPTPTFQIKDGKLQNLQSETGNPVAMSLPLPTEDGGIMNLLLLPRREVKLSPAGVCAPPEAAQLNLALREADVMLDEESGEMYVVDNMGYPWTGMQSEVPLKQGSAVLHLPILTGSNKIATTGGGQAPEYIWSYSEMPASNTTSDVYDCHLLRLFDFSAILKEQFHTQANTYCQGSPEGGDSFYSLSTLYALSLAAEEKEQLLQAADTLQKLNQHAPFAGIMAKLFAGEPALLSSLNEGLTRFGAQQLLADAQTRQTIRKCILAALSEEIRQTYTHCRSVEMQQSAFVPEMELSLQKVQLSNQGELVWLFQLRPQAQP